MLDQKEINYVEEINKLKKEKNAVILAHYYQEPDIQDIADYVGDSLGLSRKAAETEADMIVFAGVHFMAETAKILSPSKKVVIPDMKAGCSLSDDCPPDAFGEFCAAHPDHVVITYVNTSAAVKALSDICCTSSNAVHIVNSVPEDTPIIFAPDKNLGAYIQKVTGRKNMLIWDGACIVHEAFSLEKILNVQLENPDAEIIAHPESEDPVLKVAKYIGSTSGLINHVKTSDKKEFIVATEHGILHKMEKEAPGKKLIPAPSKEDNTCACSECHFMKMNDMHKLYLCMKYEKPEVIVPEDISIEALKPIERMLEISKNIKF